VAQIFIHAITVTLHLITSQSILSDTHDLEMQSSSSTALMFKAIVYPQKMTILLLSAGLRTSKRM